MQSKQVVSRGTDPLVVGLRVFVCVVCVAFPLLVLAYEFNVRDSTLGKAEEGAQLTAQALSQHANDTLETIDVVLTGLAETLDAADGGSPDIWALGQSLAAQLRQAPRIRSVAAFDQSGKLKLSSDLQVPDWYDVSKTDFFAQLRDGYGTDIVFGRPIESAGDGRWILPVARRLTRRDGSFGGVLVATVRSAYFADFYKVFARQPGLIVSLFSGDGTLLARYPTIPGDIGRSVMDDVWRTQVLPQTSGTLRLNSPIDGVERLWGFSHAGSFPAIVFTGVTPSSVLSHWLRELVVGMAISVAIAGLLAYCGFRLIDQVAEARSSEKRYSVLAGEDALTRLSNRRSFDEELRASWERAGNLQRPLSLLLIDVDHFKLFNDTHGHQAGDACLQALGEAFRRCLQRPADFVARYGGEEFAVILPDTGEFSARVVAERIRFAVLELRLQREPVDRQAYVTVSIGGATWRADSDGHGSASDLVAAADQALYRAKRLGRNRSEMARTLTVESAA
ncbi:sensor domain-containing diguanylate cyclase [Aurantimonas sp. MSK8Z-1]|uniref:GGDEF domain-containing protein n=1 Tax=Mangrovibrevibacter kandeliae TaxID=2968473 RepID=UPI002119A55C|nr:sensor domain-containing diguanylate cyclase [Aurantimonas sp. MSK8Z-1]MCW4114219.1 sensor domain-containing diguanylate cyclase [Aurantimonas sp. MSK8Z-1]